MDTKQEAPERDGSDSEPDRPGDSRRTPEAPGDSSPPAGAATLAPSPASNPTPILPAASPGTPLPSAGPSPLRYTRMAPSLPPRILPPSDEAAVSVSVGTSAAFDQAQCAPPEPAGAPAISPAGAAPSELWLLWSQLPVLGAVQIMIGLMQVVFGVPLAVSMVYSVAGRSGVSFWTGIWFIISGALTIELRRQPTRWNIKASVVTNGVSAVATAIGIIIYSVSLLFMPAPEFVYFSATTFSLNIGLLLFTVLEMGVAALVAFYSYKRLFQFESTYTILHDVITRHPSHSS